MKGLNRLQTASLRLLFLVTILLCSLSTSLGIRRERMIDTWRPLHYVVNITLDDRLSEIVEARAEIEVLVLKKVSHIDLDFGDLTIDAVGLNATATQFEHKGGILDIKLPQQSEAGTRLTLTIAYRGKPKDGLILIPDKDGKPAAVGDNWPDRVHHWIPCLDHPSAKATITFNITAPARDLVVANGQLTHAETNASGTRTWTYTEGAPIPPYCMIVAVGEFAQSTASQPAVTPLLYYVPQSDSPFAVKGFAPSAPALQLFTNTVAPYPYEKLALIIGATRFGGMENSSAIVFTSTLFNPNSKARVSHAFGIPIGTVDVVAHEIAHQWFGDSVTESTWADLWLSEGFATYFAGLFLLRHEGEEAFQAYMKQAAETYFAYEKSTRTPIHDTDTEDLFKLLNANNYQKGAWVLHMLRSQLGDDVFFRGIRAYYNEHRNATANTEDLRKALETSSGLDLREFFDRWIYGTGHPRYELSWTWSSKTKRLKLVLRQLQPEPAFPNFLTVEISSMGGTQRLVLKPVSKETIQEVRMNRAPTHINIDPGDQVLKEATVIKKS
jgi:aminopeptidase N